MGSFFYKESGQLVVVVRYFRNANEVLATPHNDPEFKKKEGGGAGAVSLYVCIHVCIPFVWSDSGGGGRGFNGGNIAS